MKIKINILASLLLVAAGNLHAGDPIAAKAPVTEANLWDAARPDSHAPIGVKGDHTHEAGEFMLSYRFMSMDMDGMRDGTDDLSSGDIFQQGYMIAPTKMEMEMHMFGFMFAPTDHITLVAMINYQLRSMESLTRPGSMARMMNGTTFTRKAEGWGDLGLGTLWKVYDANNQRIHLNLGFSAPTGEFNDLAYSMQPTTGTWDLKPGVTWLWQASDLSGGAQVMGRIHLDENKYDYSMGDSVEGNTWLAYRLNDWASLSGRLSLQWADSIDGEDSRITGVRMSPGMDPSNSGGTWLEGGLGLNIYLRSGLLKGHRFAVEGILPMYQDLNGPRMKRDWAIVAGWQKAF